MAYKMRTGIKYIKAFGFHLKKLRSDKNLSWQVLSQKSGISAGYISKIERGLAEPSLDVLYSLSVGLQVRPASLLDFIFNR